MKKEQKKNEKLLRRHRRVRAKIQGSTQRPRLSVFRSNRGLYLQLIDDSKHQTLVSAAIKELDQTVSKKTEQAFKLGELLAAKAKDQKISSVVFDRGGYKYHGRVKAVADGARAGGLIF